MKNWKKEDSVLSDADSDADVGSVLSDGESECDISEYAAPPSLPDFSSPAPGSMMSRLNELRLGGHEMEARSASPYRPVPSPGLAKVVAESVSTPNARTPLIDAIRERTAEEIVLDIEKQTQLETQDVLSDAGKGLYSLLTVNKY